MASLDEILTEVDDWFKEEVQQIPLSQITEIYNQVHTAWQSLRNRLSVAIEGKPLVPPTPTEPAQPAVGEEPPQEPASSLGEAGAISAEGSKTLKSPKATS